MFIPQLVGEVCSWKLLAEERGNRSQKEQRIKATTTTTNTNLKNSYNNQGFPKVIVFYPPVTMDK